MALVANLHRRLAQLAETSPGWRHLGDPMVAVGVGDRADAARAACLAVPESDGSISMALDAIGEIAAALGDAPELRHDDAQTMHHHADRIRDIANRLHRAAAESSEQETPAPRP